MSNRPFLEPKRILQKYVAEKQRQFEHFTAENRLEWLQAINRLYWEAQVSRQKPKRRVS
jgi:hypothetical protein